MQYLLWSILNLVLVVSILVLVTFSVFRKGGLAKWRKQAVAYILGIVGVVFVFAMVLQYVESQDNPIPDMEGMVAIEKPISSFLEVNYVLVKRPGMDDFVLSDYSSHVSGFVPGFEWQPRSLERTDELELNARGLLRWQILGMSVFSEQKEFKLELPVNKTR